MSSPIGGPNPTDIQLHLYASFLEASTYDVSLRVTGSWKALYRLNRVVLIQSGFFRSLFTSGFAESATPASSRKDKDGIIDIVFDDANITRSAFEVCIARLYGGGPPLFIPPSLVPTTSKPLTPCFPWHIAEPETSRICEPVPPNHQLASPTFLLSLLATAVYLSIPSIASHAISAILSTVGPHTVLQYLDFALGKPIAELDDISDLEGPAVGLENVAQLVEEETFTSPATSIRTTRTNIKKEEVEPDLGSLSLEGVKNEISADSASSCSDSWENTSVMDDGTDYDFRGATYHYGSLSDKIGEAAVCWLARWGTDNLLWEERYWEARKDDTAIHIKDGSSSTIRKRDHKNTGSGKSSLTSTTMRVALPMLKTSYCSNSVPLIWSVCGLSPKWINALISADTFFVRGERDRYETAKRVVELRRKQIGIDDAEERVWKDMFVNGIFYSNMTLEDVMAISQDVSPISKRPYVPLTTLQAAHWSHSVLRYQLTARPSSPSSAGSITGLPTVTQSPSKVDKGLGITSSTTEILSKHREGEGRDLSQEKSKHYYLIHGDSSLRLGDSGASGSFSESSAVSMDDLFTSPPTSSPSVVMSPSSSASISAPPSTVSRVQASEANYFGLASPRPTVSTLAASDNTPAKSLEWSPYPPCRFAVEFFDIGSLKEKSRLHSHTIWYAGSLFNVYTQIVRKKQKSGEVQTKMGIYLHRQSSVEMSPPASAPSIITERIEQERKGKDASYPTLSRLVSTPRLDRNSHFRGPSLPTTVQTPSTPPSPSHYSPSIHPPSRSATPQRPQSAGTPSSLPSSLNHSSSFNFSQPSNTLPATAVAAAPSQPYRDPRAAVSAYFMISCSNATGTSQTRFSSSPDEFAISQSWGWTSSSLRTEEYVDLSIGDKPQEAGKEVSLRATVLLGLV